MEINIEQLKTKYQSILNKADLRGKKDELKTLETQSYEPSFWQEPKKAGETMKKITDLAKEVNDLETIELLLEDNQLAEAKKLIDKYEVILFDAYGVLLYGKGLCNGSTELIDKLMSFIKSEVNQVNIRLYRADFLGCLSGIVSLLNVGEEGGVISEANVALLKREIQSFFPIFNERIFVMRKDDIENLPLAKNKEASFRHKPARGRPRLMRRLSVRNTEDVLISPIQDSDNIQNVFYKHKGQDNVSVRKRNKRTRNIEDIRSKLRITRQKSIMDILKDKKKLTIRELMSFIKDCGEKTLQRDLYELSDKGVLKKEGEKRWSAYSFVQPLLLFDGK